MRTFVLLIALATPAAAAPRLLPLRDVTVTYAVQPRDRAAVEVQVEIEGGGRHLRIASDALPTSFLVDRPSETATILLPLLRLYSTVDIARYDPERSVLQQARYERRGTRRLAGLACTDWIAASPRGHASACITDDGVILAGNATDARGPIGSLRAISVRYGQLPAGLFERPADFSNAGSVPIGGLTR